MGCIPNHATTTPSPIMPPNQISRTGTRTHTWNTTKRYIDTSESTTVTHQGIMILTIGVAFVNTGTEAIISTTILTTRTPMFETTLDTTQTQITNVLIIVETTVASTMASTTTDLRG